MARINKKYLLVVFAGFALLFIILVVLPTSRVNPADHNNLVSLDDTNYESSIRLRPGKYTVYIKTPFHTEPQTVSVGLFSNIAVKVDLNEVEAGIEQVAQTYMAREGYAEVEINRCKNIATLHYVCKSYQLSSTRPVEMIFENGNWRMNLDETKVSEITAKQEFATINANRSQR